MVVDIYMSITITHINIISRFTSALIGLARASFFIGHLSLGFQVVWFILSHG